MFTDESVLYFRSFAKYAAAFFRIAFSSRSDAIVLLSRLFSSIRFTTLDCKLSRLGCVDAAFRFELCPFLKLAIQVYRVVFGIPNSFAVTSIEEERKASCIA